MVLFTVKLNSAIMKTKFFNPFVCTCIFSLFLLQGCGKDPEPCIEIGGVENGAVTTAKQVDIAEIVLIHSTSLKYFDYVIQYYDNTGKEQRDTVREGTSLSEDCFMRIFSYDSYFVSCSATVVLIPRVNEIESFTFIKPKPYLLPIFDPKDWDNRPRPEWFENIRVESMPVEEFLSTYGRVFSSTCGIYETYDGPKIVTY